MRPLATAGARRRSPGKRAFAAPRQLAHDFAADDDDILALWAAGHCIGEIAHIVGISKARVRQQLSRILAR